MATTHDYNYELCLQKHRELEKDMESLAEKCRGVESRFWAIILLLVANLAGVAVSLAK